MRILSNGYGFLYDSKNQKAIFVKPEFTSEFKSLTMDDLHQIKGGKGFILEKDQILKLNSKTDLISILGPALPDIVKK